MDEDVLGLWALHQLASRFGDGLKPELLDHLSSDHEKRGGPNVIDGAARLLRRRVENRTPIETTSTASIVPITDFGVGSASDKNLAARAKAHELEAEA